MKTVFEENKPIASLSGVTPEMRMLFALHGIQRLKNEQEQKRLEAIEKLKTVEGRLGYVIQQAGGKLVRYKEYTGIGYEVIWQAFGETINTIIDYNFKVIEAGFCVSGHDKTQSMTSVVRLLNDYKDQRDRIVITRR